MSARKEATLNLSSSVGRLAEIQHGGLDLGHRQNRVLDTLASDAAVLDSLERKVIRTAGRSRVNLHSARLQLICDLNGAVGTAGEDRSLQTMPGFIGELDSLLDGRHAHDGKDRTKLLLFDSSGVNGDVVNNKHRTNEVLLPPLRGRCMGVGSLVHGVLVQTLDPVGGILGDDCCDVDVAVALGGAHRQSSDLLGQTSHELIGHVFMHKNHFVRRAPLSLVRVGALGHLGHNEFDIGILGDDSGLVASQLHLHRDHPGLLRDGQASGVAGEGHSSSLGVSGEDIADIASTSGDAGDDGEHITVLAVFLNESSMDGCAERDSGSRARGWGLDQNSITGSQDRTDLGASQVDGVVERRDAHYNAQRNALHHGQLGSVLAGKRIARDHLTRRQHAHSLFRSVLEDLGRANDFAGGGLDLLDDLRGEDGRDVVGAVTQELGSPLDHFGTLPQGHLSPLLLGLGRGLKTQC